MSVKLLSFTVGRERGWSAVTPLGLITAEPGVTVTIVIGETWEATADAVRTIREKPNPESPIE